jgi:alkylation response protein AidB-like acyl-CoA dehydrogenase
VSTAELAAGREALARWEEAKPGNFYEAAPHLASALQAYGASEDGLREFGAVVAGVVDPAVAVVESDRSLPLLAPRDGLGRDRQAVTFHPAQDDGARAVWASGIVGAGPFRQASLLYLLSHAGEGGHTCPVVCTAGLVQALRQFGSPGLQTEFLPPLLATDLAVAQRGAQFLTEVQGGSDVGANTVRAVEDGDGWRLSGEKWFCSVANADQFVVTARPEGAPGGTAGLGCFLVPRHVGGEVNGFRLVRLKDKLGTRALATGEIELDGALGFPIGPLDAGFRVAVEGVLNTSRWLNAVGCAGTIRRAYLEAAGYSRFRVAFGRPLVEFPLVRENLAVMRSEEAAALASTLELTRLVALVRSGDASDEERAFHRVLVNANKVVTALQATAVTRRGIEALGGNGTIEDFSPLPRLYRDAIVLESWEGTHNVLCAQVLRDLVRLELLEPVLSAARALGGRLDGLEPRLRAAVADPDAAALHFRRQLSELVRVVQVAVMRRLGWDAEAQLVERRHLTPGWDPERDPEYAELLDSLVEA